MKHLKRAFLALGFLFEYLFPLILFGDIVPYTHGTLKAGLTKGGFFALGLLVIFISKRAKTHIAKMKNAIVRESILSVFPVLLWVLVYFGLNAIVSTVASLSLYWNKVIIFIVLGRLCYIISGAFEEREDEKQ